MSLDRRLRALRKVTAIHVHPYDRTCPLCRERDRLAGWQKPVSPPDQAMRPLGMPPRSPAPRDGNDR